MKITREAPYVRRGVTQLMYVGDDDAVEHATGIGQSTSVAKIIAVAAVAFLILGGISSDDRR